MQISANPAIQQAIEAGRVAVSAGKEKTSGVSAPGKGEDFAQMLMDVLENVNDKQIDAKSLQTDYLTNRRPVNIEDVMIAGEVASTSMQLTMAVRNKVLEAYQEISRMQI